MRIPEEDLEQQMEALRHFKLAHRLRVAASEITGTLPLMKVSDYLTWLAEAILEQVLALAWHHTVSKYGAPRRSRRYVCDPGFCHCRLWQGRRYRAGPWLGSRSGVHP